MSGESSSITLHCPRRSWQGSTPCTGGRNNDKGAPHRRSHLATSRSLCRRIQRYRRGIDRPASWHLLITRDGTIYQSAPVSVGTWHVGRPGIIAGQRFSNINHATIGVELENAGRLRRIGDRHYCWPYWLNSHAPEHEQRPDPRCLMNQARAVRVPGQGIFDSFPTEQQASAAKLLGALATCFGWSADACSHGHVDFDPSRKEDPGPLWNRTILPRILATVFGGQPAEEQAAPSRVQGGQQ
ncbi:MAG: peptidoglycan recognition family protein [Pseudomonadota bacterium]